MRLDIALTEKNLAQSRQKGKNLINYGKVMVNGKIILKASYEVSNADNIEVEKVEWTFVSRAGHKLKKALDVFHIDINDKTCLDIGASTGGFTDCLLQYGAKKVYAVDCGHDQLDKQLIDDARVINMEKTNARELSVDMFDKIDFICCDVSFISVTYIMDCISRLLSENGSCVLLIKPQFEVGKEFVSKNGIVRDKKAIARAIDSVIFSAYKSNLYLKNIDYSPIKGGDGNIEFIAQFDFDQNAVNYNTKKLIDDASDMAKG